MKADLHLHTSASDGTKCPRDVAKHAFDEGIGLFSVTDHDTVDGLSEAAEAAAGLGIAFVPGIEISARSNQEIHILGYNVDYRNPEFCEEVKKVKHLRSNRNRLIGEKLAALGVRPDMDFEGEGVGRMNIARRMVEEGTARDVQDAFNRYLGPDGKAYVDARRVSPLEAVRLIKSFGGLAVLAHPKKYMQNKTLVMLIEGLKRFGLGGLETRYPTHTPDEVAALEATAARYGLVCTGGSDYHGDEDRRIDYRPTPATLRALGVRK